jgi:hypothetical protein
MLPPPPVVYTLLEIADRLNLTVYTIRNYMKAGKLNPLVA